VSWISAGRAHWYSPGSKNSRAEKVELSIQDQYFNYLQSYLEDKSSYKDIIAPSAIGIGDPLLNSLITQINQLFERSLPSSSIPGKIIPASSRLTGQLQMSQIPFQKTCDP
jgi:tyrosine-protein kinase Etk/Wzc